MGMTTKLETTLWVDTPAFQPWMLPTVTAWADEQTYPNYVHHIDEGNRANAVKILQAPPSNPGSTAYVLTSVPHRRYWACLPPWVHVLARNADNSTPSCTPEAWAYHWLGGRPWANAKQWVKQPPKSAKLIAVAAEALQAWEDLPPWNGRVEPLSTATNLDYTMVPDLPGCLEDYMGQIVGCDIETTGLDPRVNRILGVSISVREGQGWWIPFEQYGTMNQNPHTKEKGAAEGSNGGDSTVANPALFHIGDGDGKSNDSVHGGLHPNVGGDYSNNVGYVDGAGDKQEGHDGSAAGSWADGAGHLGTGQRSACPPVLLAALESPAVLKVTHNGGFDWNFLDSHGIHMSAPAGDSKVLAYLLGLWPESAKLTLKELASRILRRPVITYGDAVGDEDTLETADPVMLTVYAAQDADITRALYLRLLEMMEKA